jgi:hypothetical protein
VNNKETNSSTPSIFWTGKNFLEIIEFCQINSKNSFSNVSFMQDSELYICHPLSILKTCKVEVGTNVYKSNWNDNLIIFTKNIIEEEILYLKKEFPNDKFNKIQKLQQLLDKL